MNRRRPDLADQKVIRALPERSSPYWNILEYCRHIGIQKLPSGRCLWVARVRRIEGNYRQTQLGYVSFFHTNGLSYDEAIQAARDWFVLPEIQAVASTPIEVGGTQTLKYSKTVQGFTIGDALTDFVAWKRIAAAKTYFQSTLSLINHHIIPRLGDVLVEEFTGRMFTEFCVAVLETAPKRGNQKQGADVSLETLDHEALRTRKKTLNTLIGILRMALRMAWENGETDTDRAWRCFRRLPHSDTPRQFFLTRLQAKALVAACRKDLSKMVLAALYSGCRVSELSRLKVRDVGCHVFGIYVAPMKSYHGRYVILPDEGMSFFLDEVEGKNEEDLVFTMASGRAWDGSHKHVFKEAVRLAGLPEKFVFHGLRHTYASQLVQAGAPLAIVAKQLGHANTDTVSRTYGHLSCDSVEQEISRRFAPLKAPRNDDRLESMRGSLQSIVPPNWSWPRSNFSKASGELVTLLREKNDWGKHQDLSKD